MYRYTLNVFTDEQCNILLKKVSNRKWQRKTFTSGTYHEGESRFDRIALNEDDKLFIQEVLTTSDNSPFKNPDLKNRLVNMHGAYHKMIEGDFIGWHYHQHMTANIAIYLTDDFTGGEHVFLDQFGSEHKVKPGKGSIGWYNPADINRISAKHKVNEVKSGERTNIQLFCFPNDITQEQLQMSTRDFKYDK